MTAEGDWYGLGALLCSFHGWGPVPFSGLIRVLLVVVSVASYASKHAHAGGDGPITKNCCRGPKRAQRPCRRRRLLYSPFHFRLKVN